MNVLGLSKKTIRLFVLVALLYFVFSNQITAKADKKDTDINTNLNGYFFQIGDLKPGDWMPRNITIVNDGKQNFHYTAVLGKKESIKGLLEELNLVIKKGEEVLYSGKLVNFQSFPARKLEKGTSEILLFQISMPYELGNEFQKSSAEVEILFVAEALTEPGDDGPIDNNPGNGDSEDEDSSNPDDRDSDTTDEDTSKDNSSDSGKDHEEQANQDNSQDTIIIKPEITENILPDTATNIFNLLLIGGVLLATGSILLILYLRKSRFQQIDS